MMWLCPQNKRGSRAALLAVRSPEVRVELRCANVHDLGASFNTDLIETRFNGGAAFHERGVRPLIGAISQGKRVP